MVELGRRDAIAALVSAGVMGGVGAGAPALVDRVGPDDADDAGDTDARETLDADARETLVAVARVLYPSELTGVEEFVTTYSLGRVSGRPAYAAGMAAALSRLDDLAVSWYDGRPATLEPADRDRLLREVGAETAAPVPGGSPAERIRHYVVNELLYALYTSPAGGRLVGIENPPGHPGGLESYRRGPR